MVNIIVRSGTKHFQSHYNRTMGKYYGTQREYLSDLKSKGMEPYDPSKVKRREPAKYKPSAWALDVAKAIQRTGGMNGSVAKELHKAKMKKVPKSLMQGLGKGGFF